MATERDYERLGAWAVMLNPDAKIDRHHCSRQVPMEVLSLGFSRTGTLSLQEALTMLGYPTYHFTHVVSNVQDADMWQEALDAKFRTGRRLDWRQHFDRLLGHVGAVTDTPAVMFGEELVAAYPDAKVILVERDVEAWYPSGVTLIEGIFNPVGQYVLRYTDPFWFGRIVRLGTAWVKAWVGTTSLPLVKERAKSAYLAHYARIRAVVPKERLLEYQLGTGWEPLCEFLGKPVPPESFSRRNETATLKNAIGTYIAKGLRNSLANIVIVAGPVLAAAAVLRRFS